MVLLRIFNIEGNKEILFYKKIYFILFIQCVLGTYLDNIYNKNKALRIQNERLLAKNDFPKKRENKDLGVPLSLQNEHIRLKNKSENIPMNKTVEVCRKNAITHNKNGLKVSLSYHNGNMKFKNEAENMPLNAKVDRCRKNSTPHNKNRMKTPLSYHNENMKFKNEAENMPLPAKVDRCRMNSTPHNKNGLQTPLYYHNDNMKLKNYAENISLNKKFQECRTNDIPYNDKELKKSVSYNKDNMKLKNEAGDIPLNKKDKRYGENDIQRHSKNLKASLSCNKEEIMLKNYSKNISTNKGVDKYAKNNLLCDNKSLNEVTTKYKKLKWIDYYFEKKIFSHLEKLYKDKEHDIVTNKNSKRSFYGTKCVCGFLTPVILLVGAINYIFFGPHPLSFIPSSSSVSSINPLYSIPCVAILAIYLSIIFYIIVKAIKYKRLRAKKRKIK
ncbi:variable surface protein [Plasmodium gonderi]|uniref:Variable surface protein n=1 Tax=Plasmodium gonderi TaxID=77519 RepID=A0A1Y1JPB0_PLAGO|nr:variable surface protein [Plasmodium gonderi]GAW84331.1 variable surface protein [Plasmodium gonderi]